MATPEPTEYTTYGPVRGQGPVRETEPAAREDLESDQSGCAAQGGYSDRAVVGIVDERLVTLEGEYVWPAHGRSHGVVKVER